MAMYFLTIYSYKNELISELFTVPSESTSGSIPQFVNYPEP